LRPKENLADVSRSGGDVAEESVDGKKNNDVKENGGRK